jgi:hypothetical protein
VFDLEVIGNSDLPDAEELYEGGLFAVAGDGDVFAGELENAVVHLGILGGGDVMISPHRDDVAVGMGDAESGDGIADALRLQGLLDAEEMPGDVFVEVDEVIDVDLWQDDGVALPDRSVVEDREDAVIFIKFPGGDSALNDFAEDAAHGDGFDGGIGSEAGSFERSLPSEVFALGF